MLHTKHITMSSVKLDYSQRTVVNLCCPSIDLFAIFAVPPGNQYVSYCVVTINPTSLQYCELSRL